MHGLSIVIPCYNSAEWIPDTLKAVENAAHNSVIPFEVVLVDDGSKDNTLELLKELESSIKLKLTIVKQENKGRFLARWSGIQKAKYQNILLLDSRVIMGINSLNYISHNLVDREKPLMLLAYVKTDENTGLPGLFWDVPTRLFWGKFLRKPVRVTFGLDDFDKYPKGTGCIVIDKDLLSISFRNVWPDSHASLISDDTRLLRELCNYADIVLDPEFSASYRPRTKIKDFLGHTFDRGTLFVDSYAGTSLTKKALIILAVLLPLLFVTILFTSVWIWALLLAITCLVLPAIIGLIYRASPKAVISYLVLCLPFGVLFWAGLCRGIFVHRHHFRIYQRGDN